MRIALRAEGEVGNRTALILLGEPALADLGVVGHDVPNPADHRVHPVSDIATYDVLVSDSDEPSEDIASARAAGIPLVTRAAVAPGAANGATVLTEVTLGGALAPCLAAHQVAQVGEVLELMIAWTVLGRPLRRGEAIPFPDPVGSRWGAQVDSTPVAGIPARRVAVPVDGEWGGATAQVTGIQDDGVVQRVVAVADLAVHLEAITLAAAGACVARGRYPVGLHRVEDAAELFLVEALAMGLEVATFTSESKQSRRGTR